MYYPTLKRFMDNPSYIDAGRFGFYWKNHYDYERRWAEFRKHFFNLEINYYMESALSYYVHVLVPSNKKGNTYDVVFHFFTDEGSNASQAPNLLGYYIRIFSNNPVFSYQFGYANYTNGLTIPFLMEAKIPRMVLETPAKEHNPRNNVGFDHSTFFAGMFLLSASRYLDKNYILSKSHTLNKNALLEDIRHLDQTMEEYLANKDQANNRARFNRPKTASERAAEMLQDAKSKARAYGYNVLHPIDSTRSPKKKPTQYIGSSKSAVSRVRKTTAQKTNRSDKPGSGVHRITPKRKITKK